MLPRCTKETLDVISAVVSGLGELLVLSSAAHTSEIEQLAQTVNITE
jgi:hypothetical protein